MEGAKIFIVGCHYMIANKYENECWVMMHMSHTFMHDNIVSAKEPTARLKVKHFKTKYSFEIEVYE